MRSSTATVAGLLAAILVARPAAPLASASAEDCSCTASACRKCPHSHHGPAGAEARPSLAPRPCHGTAAHEAADGGQEAPRATPNLLASCGDAHGPAAAHFEIRVVFSTLPLAGQPRPAEPVAPAVDAFASLPAPPPEPPPPRSAPSAC